ncbi:MAG: hypothetical protein U0174_03705 [Polyangiaceae bacterium]
MRPSSFTLSFLALVLASEATGCKGVRSFFLGDPEKVRPAREPVAATAETPPESIPVALGSPAPTVDPAPVPVRLPDGTLSSDEYARAQDMKAHGQLWMAHLTLAPKALSDKGTEAEKRLLLEICKEQPDPVCVAQVEGSLGKHVDSDLERAQALEKKTPKKAQLLIESKMRAGTASEAELRYLQSLCTKLHDTGCVRKVGVALGKVAE